MTHKTSLQCGVTIKTDQRGLGSTTIPAKILKLYILKCKHFAAALIQQMNSLRFSIVVETY